MTWFGYSICTSSAQFFTNTLQCTQIPLTVISYILVITYYKTVALKLSRIAAKIPISDLLLTFVTGFAKTVPNGTTIEIKFMA